MPLAWISSTQTATRSTLFRQTLTANYAIYNFASLPVFRGVTIFNDNDSSGLRFQNISYTTATATPEPSFLPAAGLLLVALSLIRRKALRP
jgi:hypothetical protein